VRQFNIRQLSLALLAFLSSMAWAWPAPAAEPEYIVFIGSYTSMVVTPEPPDIDRTDPKTGIREVIISNGCGDATIDFTVQEVLFGPPMKDIQISASLTEWCIIPIPLSNDSILVSAYRDGDLWRRDLINGIFRDDTRAAFMFPGYPYSLLGCSMHRWQRPVDTNSFLDVSDRKTALMLDHGYARREGEESAVTGHGPDSIRQTRIDQRPHGNHIQTTHSQITVAAIVNWKEDDLDEFQKADRICSHRFHILRLFTCLGDFGCGQR